VTIAPGNTATARVVVVYHPFTLANDASYNFTTSTPGFVTVTTGAIVGTLGFTAGGVTTLGGLAPTDLTATLDSANKLNVANAGGNTIAIQNKTGGSVSGVAQVVYFVAA